MRSIFAIVFASACLLGIATSIDPFTNYFCTGGVDPKTVDNMKYLRLFNDGPCSPMMLVPGLKASLLDVKIECITLFNSHPEIFSLCGWGSCGSSKAPKARYPIWPPSPDSEMSIFGDVNNTQHKCWTSLFELAISEDKNGDLHVSSTMGIEIVPTGIDDPLQGCGANAVPIFPTTLRYLTNAGYIHGLTVQSLPYDWRIGFDNNKFLKQFTLIIEDLYEITSKKVTIYAYSMGNNLAFNALYNMDQELKDERINSLISLASPYMGLTDMVITNIGLESWMIQYPGKPPGTLSPEDSMRITRYMTGLFSMSLLDSVKRFENTEWMKELFKRSKADIDGRVYVSSNEAVRMIPTFDKICLSNSDPSIRPNNCISNFFNYSSPIGLIGSDPISTSSLPLIFEKYSYNKYASRLLSQFRKEEFTNLKNPGVAVNLLFYSSTRTISGFSYPTPPSFATGPSFDPPRGTKFGVGDMTILAPSVIVPAIKWADDFNQKVENAKPTKLFEICGLIDTKASALDDGIESNNGYFGIQCNCDKSLSCNHVSIAFDDHVNRFIYLSARSKGQGKSLGRFVNWGEEQWHQWRQTCGLAHWD